MGDVFYATNKQTKVTKPNQSDVFYATNKKQGTLKPSISSFAENVSTELKSGIANSKAIAKSKPFNVYVSGNPIPHINPTKGAEINNNAAEDYAKKATAGDGFESLSLDELERKTQEAKKAYDNGFKGENALQTGLNLLGGYNAYKQKYEDLRKAYNNRLNAFNEYNRSNEPKSSEKKYNIKLDGIFGKAVDVSEHIDNIVSAGGNMFRQQANATMNATFGNIASILGFKDNIFRQGYEQANYYNDRAAEKTELSAKQLGDKYNISGQVGANVVNMIPDMIIASLTGGASVAGAAAKANLGLGAKSTSLLVATQRGIKAMAKNPIFFTSFAGELGNDYYEAKNSGATDAQAILSALTASTVNAMIEVGGVQELPARFAESKNLGKKTLDWVLSSVSEGKEEILQDFVSQLSAKAIYDKDKEVFSLTDENAVINPQRMATEFGLGAAAGGVMGGGMLTFNSIMNASSVKEFKNIGKSVRALGNTDGLIEYSKKSDSPEVREIANGVKNGKIGELELGELYAYACRDINGAIGSPVNLNDAIENFNTISESTDSQLIKGIATTRIIERLTSDGIDETSAEYIAENGNLQSTAKTEDHSEVLHEPDIKDIAEKHDYYDTVNSNLNGKPAKDSRHYHIERVSNNLGLNVSWNENVSRGKYIPSERRIVLNPNLKTSEMYNFVFKHEFTHSLEGKKKYDGFKDYVFKDSSLFEQWARERLGKSETDGEGSREEVIKRLIKAEFEAYKNSDELSKIMRDRFTMQDAEAEVLADFVGDNLLGTGDKLDMTLAELERINKRKPGIIQRIRDFISDMINRFKGNKKFGSLVNDLEYLNRRLEKVMNSKDKKTSDGKTEKYSIVALENGNTYVKASRNVISGDNMSEWRKQITNFFNELLDGEKSIDINTIDGDVLTITKSETANKARDFYKYENGKNVRMSADEFRVKLNAEAHIDEIAETSTGNKNKTADTKSHDFAKDGFTYRTAYFQDFDGTYYKLQLSVGNNGTVATVYNVGKINKDSLPSHTKIVAIVGSRPLGKLSDNSISKNDISVNTNISENTQNDTDFKMEKFSINRDFEQEYDNWDKKDPRKVFVVGNTSTVLQNLGFEKRPITWDASKIIKIQAKHPEMTDAVVKQVPNILENPIIVMRSKSAETRLTMFGEVYVDSKPILAVLELEPTGRNGLKLDEIKIASAYGKDNAQNFINNSDALYVENDKKRVSNWEMRTGLQLPVGSSLTNSNDSISKNDISVNTNISENTQNDTEEHSIAALPSDKLLDMYDNGELSREDYLAATDTQSKRLAMKYIKKWSKESAGILENQTRLEEEREKAVQAEREEQQMRKDRQSNINSIRRTVKKIDHALRANAHSKHVPEAYRNAASAFCKLFVDNDNTVFEHNELSGIYTYYEKLKGKNENADAPQYDPMVDEWLKTLVDTVEGKKLTELDTSELNLVRNLTDAFNYQLDHEAEVFLENKRLAYAEAANTAINDMRGIKTVFLNKAWNNKNMEQLRGFLYEGNMTPVYFMRRLGPVFEKIYNMLVDGEGRWARNMQSAKGYVTGKMKSYGYNKWKNDIVKFRTESGRNLTLTVEQAMQLLATAQREKSNNGQNSKHLCLGGVVIDTEALKTALKDGDNVKKIKGKDAAETQSKQADEINRILDSLKARAIQITFDDVKIVESMLTEQQRSYMKDIVDYLSTQCAAWGNEVTMQLYGYRQFLETNYFPYVSSDLFLAKDPARADSTILKSASFTKSLQKNASNPLMLSSFTDIALQHIESMCNYNAVTVPLDTLNKIFNYQVKDSVGKTVNAVKAEMERKFGHESVRYMQNFIKDLNTGVRGDQRDSVLNSLTSKFKKSAVLGNISVVVQQMSALFKGLRDIDGKYYLKALKYYSKDNYKECKRYAGVAVIKEMGRFDTGMGVKNTSWLSDQSTLREKIDDKFGAAAGKADEVAWSFLWSAAKAEIADTTNLKAGSDEFLTKAGERFTQLVNETQVYDSVLTKSQNMRSKGLMGAITSFAAEPTLAVNMLVESYIDFKEGRQGSGKKLARTVMSLLVTNIVNSALKSLVTAARDKDEDKSYLEKYLGELVSNSLGELSLFAKIPYLRDLKSIYDGYDIERQDTAVFADLIEAVKATGSESKTPYEKTRKLAEAVANVFGLPLKNVLRDAEAIARTLWNIAFDDVTDENGKKKPVFHFGEETTADGIKVSMLEGISENNILKPWHIDSFDFSKSGEYSRMAGALKKGDEKTYQKSYNRLINDGVDESDIHTGVLKQFKKDRDVNSQAEKYGKELNKNGTFKSLSANDREKLGNDIKTALAKEAMVKASEHKPTEYEELYRLFCKNKTGYKSLRAKMLQDGKTERQIDDGLEVAKYAYLHSMGIDIHKYLLYKKATTEKYADTDNSGGVSKYEKKEALNKMDIDDKTRRQIRQYLQENGY